MPIRPIRQLMGVALALAALGAAGQTAYPAGPIRLIVPFPAAGGTDVVARLVSAKISAGTPGWNFVIDNRPGAGGNIGLDAVAKAKPDGATLGMGQTANLAINPALYPTMPYQATKDFVPVAVVAAQPVVLVVRADAPYRTLADLIAAAKAKPGSLTMASAGNGTVGHLTGELFRKQAGIDFVHVPYKGAGPASTDLLGGQVVFYFATPQAAVPLIKSGKLRGLAVTSAERVQVLPDVPTAREGGLPGLIATD
jgi:tripartite-type tricarboxylate transporter receptor subunit TctC